MIKTYPGSGLYELLVASANWPADALQGSKPARIDLLPAGINYVRKARVASLPKIGQRVVAFGDLPASFLSALSEASSFAISRAERPMGAYTVPGAGAAVRALRACEDATLIAWGADPAGLEPGASRPRPIGDSSGWLNSVRVMTNGTAPINLYLRFKIGVDGRVQNCEILATARNRADNLACLFVARDTNPRATRGGAP